MTRRNPPAKWVLPTVVNPSGRRCYVIQVPDEQFHIAAFMGALLDLASAYKWSDDLAHTAKNVALVWRDVIDNLQTCDDYFVPPLGGGGVDTELMIRQNPDNPCILESSIDGTNWCPFADLSLCFSNISQPGAGAEQPRPPNTPCVKYNGQFVSNSQWVLPTNVSTGDTLDFTNLSGASNDGTNLNWWCPDGTQFFAGTCVGGTGSTNGADPLPSANRLSVIVKLGSTWYSVSGGLLTVGAGISNVQPVVQVNYVTLSSVQGSISLTVEVCRLVSSTWSSVLDFTLSSYPSIVTILNGTYVTATGYQNSGAPSNGAAQININTDPFTLTGFDLEYNQSGSIGGTGEGVGMWASGGYYGGYTAGSTGTGLHKTASGSQASVTILQPTLNPGLSGSATSTIVRLTVYGSGAKPSQLP